MMIVCPNCGQENPPIAKFCLACAQPLPSPSAGLAEERKVVTVLFADLVGFTARAEQLDPEDVRAILTPYFARVRSEIEMFGGTVEKFIGDAVMAVFGAPVSHGDDPERAVRAALAMCSAVEAMNAADSNLELKVRIAVNTGEALVTLAASAAKGEGVVAGDVVNTASRMQEAAPTNGILVGEETYRSTRTVIDYEAAEPVIAKGKQEPVLVWRAVSARVPPGERAEGRVPMLGRISELAVLQGIWDRVVTERRPHLLTVFGPAGIGKTRLATEFSRLAREAGARAIRGRSLPYGEVAPYGAFGAQLKQVAGMFDTDTPETGAEKLQRAVGELLGNGRDASEVASHLALMIGAGSGEEVADRNTLFYSARRLVEALANECPTILVFEDIHLSTASMLDLLEMLASRVRDVPLLLLTLARPELLSGRPSWGGGLPAYTALPLEPLDGAESEELARRVLEASGVVAEVARALAGTGEGNPLFIEELAASVAERGAPTGELPTSVRSIVAARLDALPPAERDALLDASVVGKVFWGGALAGMSGNGDARRDALDSLEGRDLIRRDPVSRLQGDVQYTFKHQLIREVAYGTLPRALRRERHAAVARFLEEAAGDAGEVVAALAHHWGEAGEGARAAEFYVRAGDQAGRGWAKDEAVTFYGRALELLPETEPERRRDVTRRRAVAMQAAYHLTEMLAAASRLRAISAENLPE
jgi:class 3 adenylate cyclase